MTEVSQPATLAIEFTPAWQPRDSLQQACRQRAREHARSDFVERRIALPWQLAPPHRRVLSKR